MLLFWEYIYFGWGGGGIILLPWTSYSKGCLDPYSFYFSPISHKFWYNIKYSRLKLFLLCVASPKEPPCNNFDSFSSERLFLVCPSPQLIFLIFYMQDNIIRVKVHIPWAHLFDLQPYHPRYISRTPSPYIYTLPRKSPCMYYALPHRWAPL